MQIFDNPRGIKTRWASFENPSGAKGAAASRNKGAKGRAADRLPAGATVTLADIVGTGTICRIWLTIADRSREMLRGLRIDMFWDGSESPAVSVPFGDFFGVGLGRCVPFESQFFSNPEGRSFNCQIPMPFKTGAKITLTNESPKDQGSVFYDVNYLIDVPHPPDILYFHAHWRREAPNVLGRDFDILPHVCGAGRFLGANLGVVTGEGYGDAWWGEGEVKAWIDGDEELPTLCGTGTEDYIGTAWGQGLFAHRTQGCLIGDPASREWAFYRYHLDDPVYFDQDCRIAIQTIGGYNVQKVLEMRANGIPLIPTSLHCEPARVGLFEAPASFDLGSEEYKGGWCNFYRQDDWSSTAYFYLDSVESGLPPLAGIEERIKS